MPLNAAQCEALARLVQTIDRSLHDLRIQIDSLQEHLAEVTLRGAPPPLPERRASARPKRQGPPLRRKKHPAHVPP